MLMPIIFILLWSSGALFGEKALEDSGPIILLMLRLWLAWLLVFFIYLVQRPSLPKTWQELAKVSIAGLLAQAVYLLFFFFALSNNVHPGILSILMGLQPILTALIIREHLSLVQMCGLLLGLLGLVLTIAGSVSGITSSWMGIICALIALCGITLGTILQKKFTTQYSLTSNLLIQYFASASLVSLVYISTGSAVIHWTVSYTLSLLWLAIVVSIAANYLFYYLLKHGKATNVTSYLYCVPLVTVVIDYFAFHHSLSLLSILGMLTIMFGLMLIHRQKRENLIARQQA